MSTRGGADAADAAGPIATLDVPDLHSLVIDPTNPDRALFGSHAGLQESRDGGFNWTTGTLQGADAMNLAAGLEDPETFYVAGHDVFLTSADGGKTWEPVEHDLPGTDLHAFAQDPTDPERLYTLVVGAGLFSSEDGGASWRPLPTQPTGTAMHGALATDGATLYVTAGEGILRSSDRGTSWEPLPAQPSGGVMSLAAPASAPGTLYAGTPSGLARSSDGGERWQALGPADVAVMALAISPSDPERVLFVGDDGGVYRSDDGGETWRTS